MADYWKSQPKYYCTSCNSYMADNKVTREKHEQGRRHQENVEQRLREIRTKSMQDERESKLKEECLRKMNEGAMRGMQAVAAGPQTGAEGADGEQKQKQQQQQQQQQEEAGPEEAKCVSGYLRGDDGQSAANSVAEVDDSRDWQEAKTADGRLYFWNKRTRETRWDKPKPKSIGPVAAPAPRATKMRLLGPAAPPQKPDSRPIAEKPATGQPIRGQPVGSQPIAEQPAASQPIAEQPAAADASSGIGQWTPVERSEAPSAPAEPAAPKYQFEERTLASGSLKRPSASQEACTFKRVRQPAGGCTRISGE